MIHMHHADGGAVERGRREFRTDEESSIPGEIKQPDNEVLYSIAGTNTLNDFSDARLRSQCDDEKKISGELPKGNSPKGSKNYADCPPTEKPRTLHWPRISELISNASIE
jgi:hypothetical protein